MARRTGRAHGRPRGEWLDLHVGLTMIPSSARLLHPPRRSPPRSAGMSHAPRQCALPAAAGRPLARRRVLPRGGAGAAGSVATTKYVDPLFEILGEGLRFAGRGK